MSAPALNREAWHALDTLCDRLTSNQLMPDEVPPSPARRPWSEQLDGLEDELFRAELRPGEPLEMLDKDRALFRAVRYITRDDLPRMHWIIALCKQSSKNPKAWEFQTLPNATLVPPSVH